MWGWVSFSPKRIRGSRENREGKWLPRVCDKGSRPRKDRSGRINYNKPEEHSALRSFFRPLHPTYPRLLFPSLRVRLAKRDLPRRRKKCRTDYVVLVVWAQMHTEVLSVLPPGVSACTRLCVCACVCVGWKEAFAVSLGSWALGTCISGFVTHNVYFCVGASAADCTFQLRIYRVRLYQDNLPLWRLIDSWLETRASKIDSFLF